MFDQPIDFKKLHKELSATYKRQLAIKKEFPYRYQSQPWDTVLIKRALYDKREIENRPWRLARLEFDRLSNKMTMLCCIINHAKGKLHMTTYDGALFDMKRQRLFMGSEWEAYIKEDELTKVA
jgi:hypothetical protein